MVTGTLSNLAEEGIREDTRYRCIVDFKTFLKDRSISKVSLAGKANVSIAVLNSITQGKNISAASAAAISKCLDIEKKSIFEQVNTGGKLSPKTILHHHRLLSSILSTAVQWQVIFSNPGERVKPPKVERTEAKYLDENEAKELLDHLEGENIQNKTIVHLLLYTGMRRGELCGLEWSDIDFDNALTHIRRSSLYLPEKGIFTDETKTQSSVRTIKIPMDAVQMLKTFQVWQANKGL